ncbi:MAG TPA: tripartite tricarboxylate transporter substrate-binding protein [Beijerinckiaceae bacterium]|jgi:tripartite-type tricarboxylate transporter receptor subunit TctC|nr:tripartite tricarboxylate transporter substrate-binding protein [Beijerinckiaceae bacterium]
MSRRFAMLLALTLSSAVVSGALADPVEDFYRGKTLDLMVPSTPGSDYDIRARLVARYLTRHLPGHPNIITRNMSGGIQAANDLATVAPRDGTALELLFQGMATYQAMGGQGVGFDVRKFGWIGNMTDSPNLINSWYTTGIKTIQDAMEKELVLAATGGVGTPSYIYPTIMNALVGTKFRLIMGYPGGPQADLAMEKGEIGGRGSNAWATWKSLHPEWVADKKLNILVQVGLKRAADLPDVPLMSDLAKNDADRQVLTFLSADMEISRGFATTAGVPPQRLAALRQAFSATMKDPDFLAEVAKSQMDVSPSSGEEAQKLADSILDYPADVIDRAKTILAAPVK